MTERDGMERDGGRGFMSDLAAELTLLRKGMEEIFELLDKAKIPPDHGERIGGLAQKVTALSERIKEIEASEALKNTPKAHAEMMDKAADSVAEQGRKNVQEARQKLINATDIIRETQKQARHPYVQKVRNRQFLAGGVVASALLWFLATAEVFNPAHSIWPYRMMNEDTLWDVGWDFLERHNSKSYDRVLKGFVIYKLNADAFAKCETRAGNLGMPVQCTFTVQVPK